MHIQKIGHCCLVIEVGGVRIMTDPGRFTREQVQEKGIDVILITHLHADHLDQETFPEVIAHNPTARIITNTEVAGILLKKGIEAEVLEEGTLEISGVAIGAHTTAHEHIYDGIVLPKNVGYVVSGLYIPGDSYTVPDISVDVLALPISAPWGKVAGAIDFARSVGAKRCFPIHDGILSGEGQAVFNRVIQNQLEKQGIVYTPLSKGEGIAV
ncbi:MAG: MBL fold metallo-hydrolase [bacterium]|nr:MBL fold metallo-hydrolase [bacterium]